MADWIPGINVGNALKQIGSYVGLAPAGDYDVLGGVTNNNRPGQVQVSQLPDVVNNNQALSTLAGAELAQPGNNAPLNLGQMNTSGGDTTGVTGPSSGTTDPVAQAQAQAAAAEAAKRAQTQRDLTLQQSYLTGAEGEFNTSKSSIAQRLAQILEQYRTQTQRNEGDYSTQSGTNQSNYNRNLQEAMLNAARGRQGLFGTLASLGALSGSGIQLADQAVQQGANLDISGADETFRDNQVGLDQAIREYRDRNALREQEAQSQSGALNQQAQNNFLKTQQEIFVKMADLYNTLGDQAQADNFTRQAAELSSRIGPTGVSPVASLSPAEAAYTPGGLGNYVGGTSDVSVSQGPATSNLIPSLLAQVRRREQTGV